RPAAIRPRSRRRPPPVGKPPTHGSRISSRGVAWFVAPDPDPADPASVKHSFDDDGGHRGCPGPVKGEIRGSARNRDGVPAPVVRSIWIRAPARVNPYAMPPQ